MSSQYGPDLRSSESYWVASGPSINTTPHTCRACKSIIQKGETVMCRDGRKLRFFYHAGCFTGSDDPRTQANSSYEERRDYHKPTAPALSSLEGPRAYRDADGRVLGREVFKPGAPSQVGRGKWSTIERGYKGPPDISEATDSLTEFIQRSSKRSSDPGKQLKAKRDPI